MSSSLKKFVLFSDSKKRKLFSNNEIFFDTCSIIDQSNFSNNLSYVFFKRRLSCNFFTKIKNRCVYSGYTKSVNSKLKISRHVLSSKILNGSVSGFYRSI